MPRALVCVALAALGVLAASTVAALAWWPGARVAAPAAESRLSVTVDARRPAGAVIGPRLFGLGVDLSAATYSGSNCGVLAGVDGVAALVRIGAANADDYDWTTDTYYDPRQPRRHPTKASAGCPASPDVRAASVLRVLARARALRARVVVVLNGEIDDPRSAYDLARLIAARAGVAAARAIYWEIGNTPAQWQHFGVPLRARADGEHLACSPDQYAAVVTSYAAAVAAALGVPGEREALHIVADAWITNATDQSWASLVAAVDTRYYPYISLNAGPADPLAVAQGASRPPTGTIPLVDQLDGLRASLDQYSGSEGVGLFVGQWNANADPYPPAGADLYDSYGQAVFVADLLVRLVHAGVSLAAWGQPVYGSPQAPFVDIGAGYRPTPGFAAFGALRRLAGTRVLPMDIPPTLGTGLTGLAVRRPDRGLTVVLVRTEGRGPATLPLRLLGGPAHPVRATLRTFSARAPGGARSVLTLDPADARLPLPAPGVAILTLPPIQVIHKNLAAPAHRAV